MKVSISNFRIPSIKSGVSSVNFPERWLSIGNTAEVISGTFSKEEIKSVNKRASNLIDSNISLSDLIELKQALLAKFMLSLKNLPFDKKIFKKREMFDYQPSKITNKLVESIRKQVLELFSINQAINKDAPEFFHTPYSKWFETDLGMQNNLLMDRNFIHPTAKISYLTSYLTKEDLEKIQKYKSKNSSKSIEEIFKQKTKLLKEMMSYSKTYKTDFIGCLSKKELAYIKKMSLKYFALNSLQNEKNVNTYFLESVLCSYPINNDMKIGEYIPNLGLITDKVYLKTQAGDIPAFITYSTKNKDSCFNMYDISYLSDLRTQIQDKYNSGKYDLTKLEEEAKLIVEKEKNAKISSIQFSLMDKSRLNLLLNNNKISETEQKEITEKLGDKPAYFVSDFINHDGKKYPKAGIVIGLTLLKLFAQKNCVPIFLNALAYGENKKRSPVRMYERIGFKPISHTFEEINNLADNNKGNFPIDISVLFMMDDIKPLKQRLVELEKIYIMKS